MTGSQRFVELHSNNAATDGDPDGVLDKVLERLFESIRMTLRYGQRVESATHSTIDGWVADGFDHREGDRREYTIKLAFGARVSPYSLARETAAFAYVEGPSVEERA